jgi:putative ABC transport system permease protein
VLGFTLGISILAGLLFGLAPAWQCSQTGLNDALKEGSRGTTSGTAAGRTRNVLLVAEVALSLVLLAGAGLMLQSFTRMLRADRGFQPEHLLTAELDFSVSGFTTWVRPTATRPQAPLRQLIDRLRSLPGVQAVGAGSRLLRRENLPPQESVAIFGQPKVGLEDQPKAAFMGITPEWLRALGGRLLRGRDFTEADILETPGVVLVNETLARRYFPSQNPIGQRIKLGANQPPLNATNVWGLPEWSEIVGLISDLKSLHPRPETVPEVYQSYWQWPMQNPCLMIRTTGDPATLAEAIRRETQAVIPNLPPPLIRTMDNLLAETVAQPRLQAGLLSLFAGLALLLTAVGLYGVQSFGVAQRRREIGVRMALGARQGSVIALVIAQGMKLVGAGVAIGFLSSLALTRVIQTLLYGVSPTDPVTFGAATLLLVVTALLAAWLPARRAAKVDPIVALRCE